MRRYELIGAPLPDVGCALGGTSWPAYAGPGGRFDAFSERGANYAQEKCLLPSENDVFRSSGLQSKPGWHTELHRQGILHVRKKAGHGLDRFPRRILSSGIWERSGV